MKLFGLGRAEKTNIPETTGEVGAEKPPAATAKITSSQTTQSTGDKSEIKARGDFIGKLLGREDPNLKESEKIEAKNNANNKVSTEDGSESAIQPAIKEAELPKLPLISWDELPKNIQTSLKFLKKEDQAKIQAVEIPSEDANTKNYQVMFTGEAAKHLFLNTFEKVLHTANIFGKSTIPDQAEKLLSESNREKNYLIKSLKEDKLYLQAQFAVPTDSKQKSELLDISVTESPWNLKTLLSEREDLRKAVLNASKQILKEKPDISFKEDLEKLNAALEIKDRKEMQQALKPIAEQFARTYSLEALKLKEGNNLEKAVTETSLALSSQAAAKEGLNGNIILRGADESSIIPGSVPIKDVSLPTKEGKYNDLALTVVPADKEINIAKLIFYALPPMADFAQSGKKLGNEGIKSLAQAMVRSTLNAEAQLNSTGQVS